MAERPEQRTEQTLEGDLPAIPPPSEAVHLPGPSYLPAIVAAGITVAIVGVLLHPGIVVMGVAIALVAVVRWIRQIREEISELPLDH